MKKRTTVLCCAIASICLLFLSSLLGIAATAWAGVSRPETPSAAQKLWDDIRNRRPTSRSFPKTPAKRWTAIFSAQK